MARKIQDYNQIAQSAMFDAQSNLNKAEDSIADSKRKQKNIADIGAFLALRSLKEKNFKTFESRFNEVMSQPFISDKIKPDNIPDVRDVYNKDARIKLGKGIRISFDELNKLVAAKELKLSSELFDVVKGYEQSKLLMEEKEGE
jgi:hypothetical protein